MRSPSPRAATCGRRALLVLPLALLPGAAVLAADPSQFSQAEKLVFTDDHLGNVKRPASLRYRFVKSGSLEAGFEDTVRIDVDRARTVSGSFLSGERRVSLPDIPGAEANPVVLFFLEHDIRDMERLTKGKSAYFRKRIRMGMVDLAEVRDTRISYEGKEVAAKEVSLRPYANDPLRSRYDKYADKRYTFVLSSAVPGSVYEVRTTMPGAAGAPALIEEVMTLAGTEALKAAPATPTAKSP